MAKYIPEFCAQQKCQGFWQNGLWNCHSCNISDGYYYYGYHGNTSAGYSDEAVFGQSYSDYYDTWSGCLHVIYENCHTNKLEYSQNKVIINVIYISKHYVVRNLFLEVWL